ncbi:hypothetical protein [Thiothrix nivea]|uniref:Uncharacterized protein n=1 Tax=Thiothrix nivea (strain ATCC 35100 / DSM 5205 / JP2) TaxID=870187 RepID=A0A656HM10_THINJ|nr:hypothetical protein [Thiothrix nivea]EIJ36339.1 hypothetical protein Thini_3839 [Thiothrix nivea DSM 5205]
MLLTIVILLTLLTQVGGLLWLLSLRLANLTRPPSRWLRRLSGLAVFLLLYAVSVAVVVPELAAKGGRVPLPCFATEDTPLEPANLGYCLLMRNYVKPTIKTHLTDVARQFQQTYPDTTVRYLDAGFPFLDGFPLLPHLSHTDGGKVDLAYFYQRKATGEPVDFSPAWLGYWFYEQPSSPKEQACPGKPAGCAGILTGYNPVMRLMRWTLHAPACCCNYWRWMRKKSCWNRICKRSWACRRPISAFRAVMPHGMTTTSTRSGESLLRFQPQRFPDQCLLLVLVHV